MSVALRRTNESALASDQADERRRRPTELEIERVERLVVEIAQPPGSVQAIANFGQRAPCRVQELQPFASVLPAESFDNIGNDRVRGAPQLGRQTEAFIARKPLSGQPV